MSSGRARPEARAQRHHQPLAEVVDRRVRDLREALLEVVEHRSGPGGDGRERHVVAHREGRLLGVGGHGLEHHRHLLPGDAERDLLPQEVLGVGRHRRRRARCRPGAGRRAPTRAYGCRPREPRFTSVSSCAWHGRRRRGRRRASRPGRVGRGAPCRGPRPAPHPTSDAHTTRPSSHTCHRSGTQPVAVERGADAPAVGEHEPGGPVPRVGEARVVAEEVAHAAGRGRAGPPTPRARASRPRGGCRGRPARAARRRSRACRSRSRRDRAAGGTAPRGRDRRPRCRGAPRAIMRSSLPRDGVDLAVVAQVPERLGALPRRRRVRREAAVEDRAAARRSRRRRDRGRTRRAGR